MVKFALCCLAVCIAFFGGYHTATQHYLVALEDTQKRLTVERMTIQAEQLRKSNDIYQELNLKYQESVKEKNEIEKQFDALVNELDADWVLSTDTDCSDTEYLPSDTEPATGVKPEERCECTAKDLSDLKKHSLTLARDYDLCATDYNKLLDFYNLLKEQYN